MSARTATAVFLGWLIVAFFIVSVVTIYGFDYFEGALGGRVDNLFLNMALYVGLALVITVGFAVVLIWCSSSRQFFQGTRLLIAAAIACGLAHTVALVGPLFEHLGSWQVRLGVIAVYGTLVGAVIAGGLLRFARGERNAA
jgi:hypothetical protein